MVKRGPRKTCESTTFGKRTKFSKGPPQNTQHWKSSESVTNGLLIRMQAEARNPQAKIRTKPTRISGRMRSPQASKQASPNQTNPNRSPSGR